ncbi:MAG: 4Fe-4S binding protein [Clostridiaceae bacterium]|nr:4Fe-4S binding protein [Clostridiaceae bacterium]
MARVIFDEEMCKGCRLCTTVCPRKIVIMKKEDVFNSKGFHPAAVAEMEKCTGCCFCAIICPDCVIEVQK